MARSRTLPIRAWKLPSFENATFMLVFLGLPLAIYVVFVISPFVQAFYYSMTDWTGFSKKMNFVGFDNYLQLARDPTFIKAVLNSIVLVLVLPPLVIVLSLTLATLVTVGGVTRGEVKGLRHSDLYRVISFFPYTVPAIVIGILWAQMYDPSSGLLNGILTALGFDFFKSFAWLGKEQHGHGRLDLRHHLVDGRLLHGAVCRRDQRHPVRDLRSGARRWRWTLPHGHQRHRADDPRHHSHVLHLSRHPGARCLRLYAGAQPSRRSRQLHGRDLAAPARHRVQEGRVRLRDLDGRDACRHHPGVRGHRFPRLLAHRREEAPAENSQGGIERRRRPRHRRGASRSSRSRCSSIVTAAPRRRRNQSPRSSPTGEWRPSRTPR